MKICDSLFNEGVLYREECVKWMKRLLRNIMTYINKDLIFLEHIKNFLQNVSIKEEYEDTVQREVCKI